MERQFEFGEFSDLDFELEEAEKYFDVSQTPENKSSISLNSVKPIESACKINSISEKTEASMKLHDDLECSHSKSLFKTVLNVFKTKCQSMFLKNKQIN